MRYTRLIIWGFPATRTCFTTLRLLQMSEKHCTLNNEVRNTLPSMRPEFWKCVDAYWLQKTDTHPEEKPVLKFEEKLMFCFEEFEKRTVGHTFKRINNIISETDHALNTSAFGLLSCTRDQAKRLRQDLSFVICFILFVKVRFNEVVCARITRTSPEVQFSFLSSLLIAQVQF